MKANGGGGTAAMLFALSAACSLFRGASEPWWRRAHVRGG